jgi:hypothetical protein
VSAKDAIKDKEESEEDKAGMKEDERRVVRSSGHNFNEPAIQVICLVSGVFAACWRGRRLISPGLWRRTKRR